MLLRFANRYPLLLAGFLPLAAFAAEKIARSIDAGEIRFWVAFGAVQILAFAGYGASSLPEWAKWVDLEGGAMAIVERRLKILQGLIIALLAGNIAYYGGYYYAMLAEIVCFIGAAVAAYGGDRFLSPLLSRITGRVQAGP